MKMFPQLLNITLMYNKMYCWQYATAVQLGVIVAYCCTASVSRVMLPATAILLFL